MKVLLTGGTGYIGSAVLAALTSDGIEVNAVVRSAAAAARVTGAGASAVVGDASNVPWLTNQLATVDGAIHTAAPATGAPEFDAAVVAAVIAAFGGTSKPFVHTGGIWSYGSNANITEASARNPPPLTAWRSSVEAVVLDSDVVATVIEPAIVYGGGGGIMSLLEGGPRTSTGALELIGDGTQHWATVHVDDLAELYRRVLSLGEGLGYVIGASGANPTVEVLGREIAGVAGVVPSTRDSARARLGSDFADALLLDQQATGAQARSLGWTPIRAPYSPQSR